MANEQRWSARKEISIDVGLHYPPIGLIRGVTRNISLEGMFVELRGARIPEQTRLEISFTSPGHGKGVEHRLPAYVVHSSERGVGLMLQHTGYQEFDALRHMLKAA
ncbi:MAG TPA: PilZ domain-containing protein [Gammaproteobacteria bacterium]|nr:PilZ domain-containing protein [Gammaproteobacteria bacterium]